MISFPNPFSLKGSEKKIIKVIDRLDINRSENLSFTDPAAVKVAAIPVKLRPYKKLDDYVEHLSEKMALAVEGGAQMVCFPELIGFAPLSIVPKYDRIVSDYKLCESGERGNFTNDVLYTYYDFLQEVYFTTFSELACQYGVYVLAGSIYLFDGDNLYNRSYLFDPDGDVLGYQNKTHLAEDEVQIGVTPGNTLTLFDTKIGKFCVSIGQDSCYFEVYRIAKGLGAQVMLCPTCNINYGCRYPNVADVYLRVQETALFAVKSTMVGDILQRRFGGVCGIYCPSVIAAEKQGILASSDNDAEKPVVSRINLTKLDNVFNPYACDINEEFSQDFAQRHFGETQSATASSLEV
ncbi:putative amidohydrolase [Hydrogenoanaerobacterium saccharovorans]|uniref:Predicted amidohydrolase n=1 Tax=Hydrogenoanaerobacterium saccharovorans TaxID=474960 RepID=A0A1H8CMN1_9FIRM|nr:nitrilase-related carbon-nitrogen hydrolase [Hydrogenoanaerobacterium saccharovorans]RPF43184.1 putative amidohydrolase [Hydrogenoanaerobacterium saccharovorans]SEM95684.1 Predicted amidohydrolase [Hydrogenoanaerobacterium saccharovorans]